MIREYQKKDFGSVKNIFWLTSAKKNFDSDKEKIAFQNKYLDFYLEHSKFKGLVYVEDNKVVGYIIGLHLMDAKLINDIDSLVDFKEHLKNEPSELHINFDPAYQGGGRGSKLLKAYEELIIDYDGNEIFLITLAGARNESFYLNNGYQLKASKTMNTSSLVLLTKSIK